MILSLFLKGLIVGFAIAMPVGPIGILCIQNSLSRGIRYGLAAGLGAAIADTIYGFLAAIGITLVSQSLETHHILFQFFGSLLLCLVGWRSIKRSLQPQSSISLSVSFFRVFITTFFLTLTNPLTILGFTGIYAGMGMDHQESGAMTLSLLTLGVFIGSVIWWFLLSCGASHFAARFKSEKTVYLNKISGFLILIFGLIALINAVKQLLF